MREAWVKHLPFDRVLQLSIVGLATASAVFIQTEVHRLRTKLEHKKSALYEFLASQSAVTAAGHGPEAREAQLRRLVKGRSWARTFGNLRPTVLMTDTGPVLRLARQRTRSGVGDDK